ncbi:MAG: TetR/AcrR family transcriptional regulator [Galactobacter sp.]|uniref:TetR/AcrR family transcriptional regulator n=1 Tax=Galactobacter sp. TaxID=2676125 RepID=UPI0025C56454|nr:TetR/AcrR family transcriptional regulator [Galactobacter sp.]
MADTYHHGDLRAQVLSSAAELIDEVGADGISLRELARRAGVSHAAPAHHFGDRKGLLTALAARGFDLLADALLASVEGERFDLTAVAYVNFAVTHRGYYAVMFRPDLLDGENAALVAAQSQALKRLEDGLATVSADRVRVDEEDARRSAWALVHGLASLINAGVLPGDDPESLVRAGARQLFGE